jgi:cbb3-type cytochrome oxidase maturation protein
MTALIWLVPVALALGGVGLAAFLWSLRNGQFDDLEGASWRALDDGPLSVEVERTNKTATTRAHGEQLDAVL